jgi:hypothetical protein
MESNFRAVQRITAMGMHICLTKNERICDKTMSAASQNADWNFRERETVPVGRSGPRLAKQRDQLFFAQSRQSREPIIRRRALVGRRRRRTSIKER